MTTPGQVALVTGGSAGIGLAIVEQLLEQDYVVLSLDLQPGNLKHPSLWYV